MKKSVFFLLFFLATKSFASSNRLIVTKDEITKVVAEFGMQYPPHANIPTRLEKDFFGIQRIKPMTMGPLFNIFKQLGFQNFVSQNTATSKFKAVLEGFYQVDVFLNHTFIFKDEKRETAFPNVSVIRFSNLSWKFKNIVEARNHFARLVHEKGFSDSLFFGNPYFRLEREANAIMNVSQVLDPVECQGNFADFLVSNPSNGPTVYLLKERQHGNIDEYKAALQKVLNPFVDWVAMEMIPHTMQKTLDDLNRRSENPLAATHAENAISEYFKKNWHDRFEGLPPGSENPYFNMTHLVSQEGKDIYGIDSAREYSLFGYGEGPGLGAIARNILWADSVPLQGKGIIYGGSSHFTGSTGVNVQDFLKRRFPWVQIYCD